MKALLLMILIVFLPKVYTYSREIRTPQEAVKAGLSEHTRLPKRITTIR